MRCLRMLIWSLEVLKGQELDVSVHSSCLGRNSLVSALCSQGIHRSVRYMRPPISKTAKDERPSRMTPINQYGTSGLPVSKATRMTALLE